MQENPSSAHTFFRINLARYFQYPKCISNDPLSCQIYVKSHVTFFLTVFCTPLTAVINFESRYFFFLIVFISDKTGHARLLFFLRI